MIEPRVTAVTIQQQAGRTTPLGVSFANMSVGISNLTASAVQAGTSALTRVGVWAADTAQQFGVLVAVLMGPAVFSAYAFAAWALAANLGWTDSFVFTSGALSNWLIWMGMAVLVNTAAAILKKHTQAD